MILDAIHAGVGLGLGPRLGLMPRLACERGCQILVPSYGRQPIGSLVCVQARVSQHFREFELVNREISTESVRLTDFP